MLTSLKYAMKTKILQKLREQDAEEEQKAANSERQKQLDKEKEELEAKAKLDEAKKKKKAQRVQNGTKEELEPIKKEVSATAGRTTSGLLAQNMKGHVRVDLLNAL